VGHQMFRASFICAILVVLISCAPRMMTADQDSISFVVMTGIISNNTQDAQLKANTHCAKYGKSATLDTMNVVGEGSTIAVFKCVIP